mmetsp:Transcript_9534/g.20874  ORF Transcript_9534/g.20874 Transcript_9534/m.20874 type:complete len:202 (-) Transcript_9534:190-795(-)
MRGYQRSQLTDGSVRLLGSRCCGEGVEARSRPVVRCWQQARRAFCAVSVMLLSAHARLVTIGARAGGWEGRSSFRRGTSCAWADGAVVATVKIPCACVCVGEAGQSLAWHTRPEGFLGLGFSAAYAGGKMKRVRPWRHVCGARFKARNVHIWHILCGLCGACLLACDSFLCVQLLSSFARWEWRTSSTSGACAHYLHSSTF